MRRIVVDLGRCEGSQLCVATQPTVFVFGDDGYAHVVDADWPEHAALDKVDDVVMLCPADAIRVVAG